MYRVSKKIPMPTTSNRGRTPIYVFPDLEIGDSFVVTTNKERQAARKRYQHKKQTVAMRTIDGKETRIWRIK